MTNRQYADSMADSAVHCDDVILSHASGITQIFLIQTYLLQYVLLEPVPGTRGARYLGKLMHPIQLL
jgi:hypothetical protein